jgi:hypothetical protein
MLARVCKELFPQGVMQKIEEMVPRDSQASSPTAALIRESLRDVRAVKGIVQWNDGRGWKVWGYTPANVVLLRRLQARN